MKNYTLPDPAKPIPKRLKQHNGISYVMARSDDPAIKCQNIGNLVRNIKATMMHAGLLEFPFDPSMADPTLGRFLDYQILGANKSWNMYTAGKNGQAVEIANTVLGEIMFIVYDDRFTTEPTDTKFMERGQ